MIEVKNITKTFENKKALSSISFDVKNGVAFGLLGRNGAGKTTCMRIIMDIFPADSGKVLIDGKESSIKDSRIGYLPEERGLYPNRKILEQMIFIGELRGLSKTDAKASAYDKLGKLEALEYKDQKLSTLSKGNQQKIQLAIALINEPDIIILDEPFSGLDPVNAQLLKTIVRQQVEEQKTVIFSSHQMAQVEEFCDDICLIDQGEVVLTGNLTDIKKSYPRNIVEVEPGVEYRGDFKSDVTKYYDARFIKEKGHRYHIGLKEEGDKKELYDILDRAGIFPDIFAVQEPTLEQIFIEKVGNEKVFDSNEI